MRIKGKQQQLLTNGHRRLQLGCVVATAAIAVLATLLPASSSGAQTDQVAYTMQSEHKGPPQSVIATLYEPTNPTPNRVTALVVVHQIPVAAEIPCPEMAERGFTVVCTQETGATWDQLARGVGYGVSYARSLPGIQHVVLLGWSGGGSMVAYYQNVAENGLTVCRALERLDPCSRSLVGLPPTDGVVLLDAIPGLAFSFMSALDAATVKADGLTNASIPCISSTGRTAITRTPTNHRGTPCRSSITIRRLRVHYAADWIEAQV
ncbi:MAG: hypothetical protein WB765_19815 [Acidimicrobiales bacterium]